MSKNEEDTVQADTVEDLSPHNKALYEAGKNLLVESVSVGRGFCKFMTTTTLGAIPINLALLKLVLPKDYVLQSVVSPVVVEKDGFPSELILHLLGHPQHRLLDGRRQQFTHGLLAEVPPRHQPFVLHFLQQRPH